MKTLNPFQVDWDDYEYPKAEQEKPQPTDVWYAPFHKAIRSGMVEGGKPYAEGPDHGGNVSE
jgi:hypothetical protein